MRKLLLATSAVIAAGFMTPAHAMDHKATVSGEYLFQLGFFDYDAGNPNDREIRNDIEVHFDFEGSLDNGLKFGAQTQLQNSGNNVQTDEAYIFIEGSFGRVEMGDQDGAAGKFAAYAPAVGHNFDVDGDYPAFVGGMITPLVNAVETEDSSKIIYMTPKMGGFQAAVSWAPELGSEGTNVVFDETMATVSDFVELGASYDYEFDGIKARVAGAYSFADSSNNAIEDVDSWHLGLEVEYAGFTFGGGYVDAGDSLQAANTDDSSEWTVGLTYENGPFGVGFNYIDTETAANEQTMYSFMGNYMVAEGFDVGGVLAIFDQDLPANAENEGYVLMLQTRMAF